MIVGHIVRSFLRSVKDPELLSAVMDTALALAEALDSQPEKKKKRFRALITKEVQAGVKRLARSQRLLRKEVAQLKKEFSELKHS